VTLSEAQKDLDAVTLRAPISGTVATIPWTAVAVRRRAMPS